MTLAGHKVSCPQHVLTTICPTFEHLPFAGFATFFRLSLGGMCIGLIFGVGTLFILYQLDRRLSGEDAVVQVVATFTSAYLVFFTSEILAGCSGIIAVLFCALTIKAFGETYYNDPGKMRT